MPKLSIIIPVFNSERTITATLESIASQTYFDYEVLLIDGVSTDNTLNIIKRHGGVDRRIKWISEKDEGVYDAMNKGIRMAKGKWI